MLVILRNLSDILHGLPSYELEKLHAIVAYYSCQSKEVSPSYSCMNELLFHCTPRRLVRSSSSNPRRGGGGTPLYGLYRYVRPQRVWFFSRFGHK